MAIWIDQKIILKQLTVKHKVKEQLIRLLKITIMSLTSKTVQLILGDKVTWRDLSSCFIFQELVS
jgi:hypothetical protein